MVTTTACTYLGGGDLSWQAINWSTPDALDLWFRLGRRRLRAEDGTDAAQVLQHSAFSNNIATHVGGHADVRAVHDRHRVPATPRCSPTRGRLPNTIYMAPDRFGYLLGLTSDAFTQFTSVSASPVSGRSTW